MAHGFLQSFNKRLKVFSAGTEPAVRINSTAVKVMNVSQYINDEWDYVITVCDDANETCPVFAGKVRNRLHMGFEDPSKTKGSYMEIMTSFYDIRNEIREEFFNLFESEIKKKI
jgi:arsenate reductase